VIVLKQISSLEDIRNCFTTRLRNNYGKIKRDNGDVEYALNFSIQELGNSNKIHSY
jgi:hypothetical protein